jgi:hypothetical protein
VAAVRIRFARRWSIVAAIAACCALAGPIAAARASDARIAATFAAASRHLNADEAAVAKAVKRYRRSGRVRPVIAVLRHEVRDIRAVRRAINRQSASTRKGRRGKADVISGLSLIASAYAALATDIQKAHAGHPVPASRLRVTVARDRRGRAKLLAGLRLLGLRVKG